MGFLKTSPNDFTIINNHFRPFPSIKGISGFLGLTRIPSVCHEVETTLHLARCGEAKITAGVSEVLLERVEVLRAMILPIKHVGGPRAAPVPGELEKDHALPDLHDGSIFRDDDGKRLLDGFAQLEVRVAE